MVDWDNLSGVESMHQIMLIIGNNSGSVRHTRTSDGDAWSLDITGCNLILALNVSKLFVAAWLRLPSGEVKTHVTWPQWESMAETLDGDGVYINPGRDAYRMINDTYNQGK